MQDCFVGYTEAPSYSHDISKVSNTVPQEMIEPTEPLFISLLFEIKVQIFNYLSVHNVFNLGQCCKSLRQDTTHPRVLMMLLRRDFPSVRNWAHPQSAQHFRDIYRSKRDMLAKTMMWEYRTPFEIDVQPGWKLFHGKNSIKIPVKAGHYNGMVGEGFEIRKDKNFLSERPLL